MPMANYNSSQPGGITHQQPGATSVGAAAQLAGGSALASGGQSKRNFSNSGRINFASMSQ